MNHRLCSFLLYLLTGCVLSVQSSLSFVQAEECPIYPTPKQWTALGQTFPVGAGGVSVFMPQEADATSADEFLACAFESFQHCMRNRFQLEVTSGDSNADVQIHVQRDSKLPPDGFQIAFDGASIQLSGNGNGVRYGLDVLFQLFRRNETTQQVEIQACNVTDYPSIRWRGRPHFVLMQNLVPGALDAYAYARINFTDVRDNPLRGVTNVYPDRAAPMGFLPGLPLDRENIRRMIHEAHRRGMLVYGTVAPTCLAKASQNSTITGFDALDESNLYENAKVLYEELLQLGCDDLWLSFDDVGAGKDAKRAVRDFLEVLAKHHLHGAYTPPDGSYQHIDTPFNREMAQFENFGSVRWFFTRVPCEADTKLCQELGLKQKPGWWHNLIFLRSGFLNNEAIAVSLRRGFVESETFRHEDGKTRIPLPAYIELQPLAAGWGRPTTDVLRQASRDTDCVMLWCIGGGFPEEYLVGMFGAWAWSPETYDWERTRTAIYSHVYGPAMAQTAREFDDTLTELKTLYLLPPRQFEPDKNYPPRLAKAEDRSKALALLDRLDALCRTLCENAPKASALNADRLEIVYLEPMRKTLEVARIVTESSNPREALKNELKGL